jgi:hypothetical protein
MRLHRKNGPGLIEMAQQMLAEVKSWFPQRQFMTSADGFYATVAGCSLLHTHIISRMRRDAALFEIAPPERPAREFLDAAAILHNPRTKDVLCIRHKSIERHIKSELLIADRCVHLQVGDARSGWCAY